MGGESVIMGQRKGNERVRVERNRSNDGRNRSRLGRRQGSNERKGGFEIAKKDK